MTCFIELAWVGYQVDLSIQSKNLRFKSFLKNFANIVVDATNAEVSFDQIDIWWQDEARIGQQNTTTRIWAEKGSRPRAVRQQQFEYAYLYGAVCPSQEVAAAIVMPVANSAAMEIHLGEISKMTKAGRHAAVIMDQAGWHTSKKLKQFDNLRFIIPN